jgi:hypothetical protein
LLFGAGSGAFVGHAIGGDSEGAVVGSFIGGTLGLMIGSEMDRAQAVQTQTVYRTSQYPRYDNRQYVTAYEEERICREAEVLATVNNRPKKIFTTICREDGRWVIPDKDIAVTETVVIERPQYVPQTSFVFYSNLNPRHNRWDRRPYRQPQRHWREEHRHGRH